MYFYTLWNILLTFRYLNNITKKKKVKRFDIKKKCKAQLIINFNQEELDTLTQCQKLIISYLFFC